MLPPQSERELESQNALKEQGGWSLAPHATRSSHLILNDELPIFPGSGGVEYLTALHLPSRFDLVGLVSMVHRRADLERAQGLVEAGVRMYLWESPFLDGVPTVRRSKFARQVHAELAGFVARSRAGGTRPLETLRADGSFRNLSASFLVALSERPWAVVAVVQSHAARFLDYFPRPLVSILVMHDVRALLYERRSTIAHSALDRWRYKREAHRYRRFERKYCRQYDLVVTVSETDADYVRRHYSPTRLITRRLPIDAAYWRSPSDTAMQPGVIAFTGLMNHAPNVDAAIFMAREVLPLIRANIPDVSFWIVGRHPAPAVLDLKELPGVRVTGEVPDVRPFLARASVVVVPLRFGSGARQKILEAWAMCKCVVSTSIGAEGLDCRDGEHLAIGDSASDLARLVCRALNDPPWREALSHQGRAIVVSRHDPARITQAYADAIEALEAERRDQTRSMRVAVDMRWMIPGVAGGIEQLARAFLRELLAIDQHNAYTLIVPARVAHGIDVRRHPRVRVTSLDSAGAYLHRVWMAMRRRLLAALHLDDWKSPDVLTLKWLRSLNADMVYAFPGYTHPDVQALPQVLVVPDIQHEYFPRLFTPQALEERTRLYRDSIRRATHVCAISEFTRQTLIDKLAIPPAKITTVHLAAEPLFTPSKDATDSEVLQRYALEAHKYLFFPGHTWRHKNHRAAIQALALLHKAHKIQYPLICTGGIREAQQDIEQEVERQGLHGAVRFIGYCTKEQLPALYRNAACLVFPSLFEGFGMPVLEAMACGCPVVCSNTTSLPEIGGDAALLVDPEDHEALAEAVRSVINSRELRDVMRSRGLERAKQFSWRRHTIETLRVLYDVHQTLRGPATVKASQIVEEPWTDDAPVGFAHTVIRS